MTTLQFTNFSLLPDPLFFSLSASINVDLKIHWLNKKSHTAPTYRYYFFLRIELIVIQLGTFVKISSIPEATIFAANAFLFLRIIYPTSVINTIFLFLYVYQGLNKSFYYQLFYLDSKPLKKCLMLIILYETSHILN